MKAQANIGEQVNAWHAEWQASGDLQFQFPRWTDYAFGRRLRAEWDASPDLQRQHAGDFRAFSTAAKKQASDASTAAREKASRQEAKRSAEEAQNRGPVGFFIRTLLSKQSSN